MAQTLYAVVYLASATDPADDATGHGQIKDGKDGSGATAVWSGNATWTGSGQQLTATGLSAGTLYALAAVVYDDVALTYSNRVLGTEFTTLSTVTSDLSCSYKVRASVTSDLSCAYTVRASVTSDLSASYAVRAPVSADLSGAYVVRASLSSDLDCSYTVDSSLTPVTSDLSCSYAVRAPITADLSGAYAVRQSVTSDLSASYATLQIVQVDLTGLYKVLQSVVADLSGSYNVRADVTSDLAGSYTVQTTGSAGAAEVWGYVMSNGKTAEENVVEIHTMLSGIYAGSLVVAANVKKVNDITITGTGVAGVDPWGPA